MTDSGTPVDLLERIVRSAPDHCDETKKPASETPQMWPCIRRYKTTTTMACRSDDVTLLFCDDNWGNIRELPKPGDKPRKAVTEFISLRFRRKPEEYK